MPRLRLSVRRMMVLVALVAVVLALLKARERWAGFARGVAYHALIEEACREARDYSDVSPKRRPDLEVLDPERPPDSFEEAEGQVPPEIGLKALAEYHGRMRRYWQLRW